jgi:DNA-binding MarR family transcriptional regulator
MFAQGMQGSRQAPVSGTMNDLMGSVHAFAALVGEAIEKGPLREVAGSRVTFPQLTLLTVLAQNSRWKITDVAHVLGVSNAAASKAVDRLVRRGLLRRREAVSDRRAAELSLTRRSRRLLKAFGAAKNRQLKHTLRHFRPQALREVAKNLDQLSMAILGDVQNGTHLCLRCSIYPRQRCQLRGLVGKNCFYHETVNQH